jgi:hypothetical protein
MKFLSAAAIAVSILGCVSTAQAQAPKFFFEGDIVRGAQPGAPGPLCALNNQFKHMEKVVFRVRVLDRDGKSLDDKGLKSLVIELPDGQKIVGRFGPHTPPHIGPTTDHYWTAAWIVPDDYPTGTFAYKVVATDTAGVSQSWEPFKLKASQFTVIAGAIELK